MLIQAPSPAAHPWPVLPSVLGLTLILGVIGCYLPVLSNLAVLVTTNEDYSFGLLLPLVSAYIIYLKWPQIRQRGWRPSWMGLAVIALGFGLYIFGELAASLYIPSVSFTITLAGIVVLLGGWGLLRLLAFPLVLLVLMVPVEGYVLRRITLPLQLISSHLATWFLQSVGVPVVRQGNVIDLGVRQLQVVAACSGLRYILSLFALGTIFCYFYQRRVWKAAIIMISVIPAAILANALRVAAMGLYPPLQEGFLHTFSGWLIFIFCFGFIGVLNGITNYLQPPSSPIAEKEHSAEPTAASRGVDVPHTKYLIAGLVLVLALGSLTLKTIHFDASPVPLRQSFDNFPMKLGHWNGTRLYIDSAVQDVLKADNYLDVQYVNPQHESASLWIAHYAAQKPGASFHSPTICLTGGGWKTVDSKIIKLAPGKPVRYMLLEQGGGRQVVYYWYLQRGRWIADEFQLKFYMGIDGISKSRTDGALIRLITPAGNDVKAAQQRLAAFAQSVIPLLPQYIPE